MKNNEIFKLNDNEYSLNYVPAELNFKEYSKLKAQVNSLSSEFSNWQVTTENIKESKEVRAKLRKLSKAWNDKKIAIVKVVDKPVKEFQDNIKELCTEVDSTASVIDEQIKAFEDKAKVDKHEQHLKFIKKACEDAGVDPDKIEYNSKWDSKTFSNPKFEIAVDQQISLLLERKKTHEADCTAIIEKANKQGLNADTYLQLFDNDKPLNEVLSQIDDDKRAIIESAKKHEEFKKQQQASLVKQGDKAIDPETGEVKDKFYNAVLVTKKAKIKITGTKYQFDQLFRYFQDMGFKCEEID